MDILKPIYGEVWAASGEKLAPENTKIGSGWILEMMPYQYENFLQNRQDVAITYLLQKGVAEWSGEQEYTVNKSVVQYQGHLYIATATVTNVVPTVTTSWRKLTVVVGANGTIPVGSGGTGATTAAQARANLGIGSAGGLDLPVANGLLIKLANNTLAARSVIGTEGLIEVVNGDGVAGNPTITVGSNVVRTNADASWTTTGSIRLPTGTTAQRGVPAAGRIRFNLDSSVFEGYDGTSWNPVGSTGVFDVQNFSGDGVKTEFVLSSTPRSENNTQVYINGIYQQKNTYTLTNETLTFSVAPLSGVDNIEVVTATSITIGTTTAGQTSITDSGNYYNSGNVEGALQEVGNTLKSAILSFTDLASATTAATTLPNGQVVEVVDEQKSYRVQAGALVFVENLDQLRIDLESGTGVVVGYKPVGPGAVVTSMQAKLSELRSITDRGAIGDGVTNDTAAFQAASISAGVGGVLGIGDGKSYLLDAYTRKGYADIRGTSELIIPEPDAPDIPGEQGYRRINTGRDYASFHFGDEYLFAMKEAIRNAETVKGFIYGDSTVYFPSGVLEDPNSYIEIGFNNLAKIRGLKGKFNFANKSMYGTTIEYCNPVADVSADTKFMVFKYGLNEAMWAPHSGRPGNIKAAIDRMVYAWEERLYNVRTAPNGHHGNLSILIIGPNAASHVGYQDERWLEFVRPAMEKLCRDFKCAYFDTYNLWPEAKAGEGRWLDTRATSGPLHPLDNFNELIYGKVFDWVFPELGSIRSRTNIFTNSTIAQGAPVSTDYPSAWSNIFGEHWHYVTSSGGGWPADGLLKVSHSSGGVYVQTFIEPNTGKTFVRTATDSTGWWTTWSGGEVVVPLVAPWEPFSPGDSFRIVQSADGQITFKGRVAGGSFSPGDLVANIPVVYAPTTQAIMPVATSTGVALISIDPDGAVKIFTVPASATWMFLSGVSYYR